MQGQDQTRRPGIFGSIATIPFDVLSGLASGWWPFNIKATLLVAKVCAWLIEAGGRARLVGAAEVFIVCGALVEFWWLGLAVCAMAWTYCHRPSCSTLALWIAAGASLYVINCHLWALAALPLTFAAGQLKMHMPRGRFGSCAYCLAHLKMLRAQTQLWLP